LDIVDVDIRDRDVDMDVEADEMKWRELLLTLFETLYFNNVVFIGSNS